MDVRPIYINPRYVAAISVDRYGRYIILLSNGVSISASVIKLIRRGRRVWYYVEGDPA